MKKQFWVSAIILAVLFFSCTSVDQENLKVDYYNLALDLQKSQINDRAAFYYEKCLEMKNPPMEAYYNLSVLYIKMGELEKAEKLLKSLEFLGDKHRDFLRIQLYLAMARFELLEERPETFPLDIVAVSEKVLSLYEKDYYTLKSLAQLYLSYEEYEQADNMLETMLSSDRKEDYLDMKLQILDKQEESEPQRRELLASFQNESWMNQKHLEKLLSLNETLEFYQENDLLIEKLLNDFPENKPEWLFQRSRLQLVYLSRWEEGLISLRQALSSGYNQWSKVNQLLSSLETPLKEEAQSIIDIYNWEL